MKYHFFVLLFAGSLAFSCQNEKTTDKTEGSTSDQISTEVVQNPNSSIITQKGTGDLPEMSFPEVEYDFGTITEGDEVMHVFTIMNTGNRDLLISDVRASCGCTIPTYSKRPISPGEEGYIQVKFRSKGKSGHVRKAITVTANTVPNNKSIHIVADVVPKS